MKRLCLLIFILGFEYIAYSHDDHLLIMFWNIENFFDYTDGGEGESDREWSSFGARRWTKKRFHTKCDAVAKSIFHIADKYGKMPDVIGLAEVENKTAIFKLLNSTLLRKYDYKVVHYDSRDRRGIDVALLYRESVLTRASVSLKIPSYNGSCLATRDILHVCLEDGTGQKYNMLVNHHPSKYGGADLSDGRRNAVMSAMKEMCDSLQSDDPSIPIIAMGDFNDTPDGVQFDILDGVLYNKSDSLHSSGLGTIRYQGRWELIDMFLVSASLYVRSQMHIIEIPFLMSYEKKYPGMKPYRTYSGPRYIGGVSDHCPVILCIFRTN